MVPFEAMNSGCPTILPRGTGMADYSSFGVEMKNIKWERSPHQDLHPGDWMSLDVDELIFLMEDVINRYDYHSDRAFLNAQTLKSLYSWSNSAVSLLKYLHTNV
jgi:hypothetical protein